MARAGIRIRRGIRRTLRKLAPLGWFALLFVLAIAYVLVTASLQASTSGFLHTHHYIEPRMMDVLIFGWALWMASSIGSFLNVVAYRVPRGQSVQGRSHCPRCENQLSFRDNLPIFGWVFLRGRCRSCRLPISARYPIVEAAVGLSIALVVFARIYGWSLPHQPNRFSFGNLNTPRFDDPMGWALMAHHGIALVFAWMFGLMRFDGQKLPPKLTLVAIAVIALPLVAFPVMMVVSWRQLPSTQMWSGDGRYVDGLMRVIAAIVAAAMMGRSMARRTSPMADLKLDPLGRSTRRLVDLIALLMPITLVLGWQTGLATVTVAIGMAAIAQRRFARHDADSRWRDPLSALAVCLPVALALQLFVWRIAHECRYWPSDLSPPFTVVAWALVLLWMPSLLVALPETRPPLPHSLGNEDPDEDEDDEDDEDEEDEEVKQADQGERVFQEHRHDVERNFPETEV